MMKAGFILLSILLAACQASVKKDQSIELITGQGRQDSLFQSLIAITNNIIPQNLQDDSLAFLILPLQASCPACRKKTIDSIVKHYKRLTPDHFIIISVRGGYKTIRGYFKEEHAEIPVREGTLFLDSANQAGKHDLYDEKPTIYYTYKRKAYKKVGAIPATVRQDLQEFFSGYRSE